MPTTTTSSIGTSSRTYSTISSWEAAAPADLVASDVVWKGECYNDSEFAEAVTIAGSTNDATRYKWLTCASGQSFADHANKLTNPLRYDQSKGVGVKIPDASYGYAIQGSENNVVIERLQVTTGVLNYQTVFFGGTAAQTARNILSESAYANGFQSFSTGASTFTNCIHIDRSSAGKVAYYELYNQSGKGAHNCTFVRPSDLSAGGEGMHGGGSNVLIMNCAVFGFSTLTSGSFSGSSSNNATNAGSGLPGSSNQHSLTFASQFTTATDASRDFRAVGTGSLDTNGVRDQTYTFDLDIVGQARSTTTPTIGAWEVVAAAAITGPLIGGSHLLTNGPLISGRLAL